MVITVAVAVVAVSGVGRCGQKVTRWRTVRNQRTEESSYHFQKWLKNDLPALTLTISIRGMECPKGYYPANTVTL
uniref:Putative secreted protein n=1 Tax=Anopheles triannulatus TaxID=58253 RepID=A0A2M4B3L8_9DIPT